MNKVWIISYHQGEYGSYDWEILSIWTDKEEAEKELERLKYHKKCCKNLMLPEKPNWPFRTDEDIEQNNKYQKILSLINHGKDYSLDYNIDEYDLNTKSKGLLDGTEFERSINV